jgi:uncharacterized protein YdhG (YjbR/CyaY superfamily)
MPASYRNIDEYLATLDPERRSTLEKLRRIIVKILPKAEECISYSMPAFRFEGHVVAGFLATKAGCSYFPFSGTTLATLAKELTRYDTTKSALHFDANRQLPAQLVRKLLNARVGESRTKPAARARGKATVKSSSRAKGIK